MRTAMIAICLAVAVSAHAQWRSALAPKGKLGASITLAEGGRSAYRILLPAAPTSQERKAADDLQQWLAQMTGVRLPIVTEGNGPAGRWSCRSGAGREG